MSPSDQATLHYLLTSPDDLKAPLVYALLWHKHMLLSKFREDIYGNMMKDDISQVLHTLIINGVKEPPPLLTEPEPNSNLSSVENRIRNNAYRYHSRHIGAITMNSNAHRIITSPYPKEHVALFAYIINNIKKELRIIKKEHERQHPLSAEKILQRKLAKVEQSIQSINREIDDSVKNDRWQKQFSKFMELKLPGELLANLPGDSREQFEFFCNLGMFDDIQGDPDAELIDKRSKLEIRRLKLIPKISQHHDGNVVINFEKEQENTHPSLIIQPHQAEKTDPDLIELLPRAIEALSEKQRLCIMEYFGINQEPKSLSLRDSANKMNISHQSLQENIKLAIKKIRQRFETEQGELASGIKKTPRKRT